MCKYIQLHLLFEYMPISERALQRDLRREQSDVGTSRGICRGPAGRVEGIGFRVRVEGLGSRVWSLDFRV